MVDLLLQVIRFVAIRVLLQHKDWEARMAGNVNAASIYSSGGGEIRRESHGWILGAGLLLLELLGLVQHRSVKDHGSGKYGTDRIPVEAYNRVRVFDVAPAFDA